MATIANPGYTIASGSQTVTEPSYNAFGTEVSLQKTWENVWLRKQPLLAMIKDGSANWKKGSDVNGTQMLVPIVFGDTSTTAAGVLDANELSSPITPYVTTNFTQAAYNIAHYRHAFYVRKSEDVKINNVRGNFLQGKIDQLTGSFVKLLSADLMSNNTDAQNAVLGIQYALGNANTVGLIDQTSNDWGSNVLTGGVFTLDNLDQGIDAVTPRGGNVNLILMAYSTTNNLFGKLRAAISPNERMVNTEFQAKYGYKNIDYLGATCISDNILTAGVIVGMDTTKWFYQGDDVPKVHHVQPYPGTDAMEHLYYMFCGVGTSNPAANFKSTANT